MREDNPEKRMFYKFIFLLVVTVLIVIVYIWKWMADDPKDQDQAEMFRQEEQEKNNEKQNGLNEEEQEGSLNEESTNFEVKEGEAQQEFDENKDDLEQSYFNQYGKEEIEQAKEQAKTVLALYLLQVTDWDKWEGTVTADYLQSMKRMSANATQENIKRELDEIELFASQPQGSKTITYGAFASWHVTIKGKSISQPMQLYYITLEKEGDDWIVNDMVTPDNHNMEGERKEGN